MNFIDTLMESPLNAAILPKAKPRRIRFRPNWKIRRTRVPEYLLMGAGDLLDEVADALIDRLGGEEVDGLRVGSVHEARDNLGKQRSVRARLSEGALHSVATDLHFRRQGRDLCIRFDTSARSGLRWLQFATYGSIFAMGWMALYGTYFAFSDAYTSLLQEYARKYSDDPIAAAEAYRTGHFINSNGDVVRGAPMKISDIAQTDPKLFLMNMSGPPALIAALIGGVVYLLPKTFLTLPCRLLGWPTPHEFETLAASHAGWVESNLSSLLLDSFGIHEGQMIRLDHR